MEKVFLILISIAISVGVMALVYRNRVGEKLGQKDLAGMLTGGILSGIEGVMTTSLPVILLFMMDYSSAETVFLVILLLSAIWTLFEFFFYTMFVRDDTWYGDCKYVYDFCIYHVVGVMMLGVMKVGTLVVLGVALTFFDMIVLMMGYFIASIIIGYHEGKAKIWDEKEDYKKEYDEKAFQEKRKGIYIGGIVVFLFSISIVLKGVVVTPIVAAIESMLFFETVTKMRDKSFREELIKSE